ncbi:MAG: hypothetical protein R3B06_33025, partial [Kofleriaceae bacterium]
MAELQNLLARLDSDPDDPHARAEVSLITAAAASLDPVEAAMLVHARKKFRERGRADVALALLGAEL